MTEPAWLDEVAAEAGRLLGLPAPLVFPPSLVEVFAAGAETPLLDGAAIPEGRYATPAPEFGVLGADMPAYFSDYEFAEYMAGAWPLALDGAGGFYCLDLRAVMAGAAPDDGSAPLVWAHSGSLGWGQDDHVLIATDASAFFATALTGWR